MTSICLQFLLTFPVFGPSFEFGILNFYRATQC